MKKIPALKDDYYSISEFCDLFGISRATFYRRSKGKGQMPKLCYLGKRPLIARNDIFKWLKDNGFEVEL